MAEPPVTADHLLDGHLSVVVFGPGHGEAVLVRFPDESLGVVDGCMEGPGNPVLRLIHELRRKGAAPLRFAALTHPHEDHLLGLREVIAEFCPSELWFAGAEHPRMFGRLLKRMRQADGAGEADADPAAPSGHKKLGELVKEMVHRIDAKKCSPHVLGDRQLHVEFDWLGDMVRVRALLPTTTSKLHAWNQLGTPDVLPVIPGVPADVETLDDRVNELSAVLLVEWGTTRVLLGGDAELGAVGRGWRAVDLKGPIHLVKVPHHASSGAFHEHLWKELAPKLSVVTPFQHGAGAQPPQRRGLDPFALHTEQLLLTSPPDWLVRTASGGIGGGVISSRPHTVADPESAVVVNLDAKGAMRWSLHGRARRYLPER
jgi:hypothetical protein